MEDILIGTTDRSVPIFIPDPASTTGAGKTGLNAAAVTVTYTRYETDNDVIHTDVTSSLSDLSALTDAHADWGWKEVSSTLSKGLYRLDVADAVFASGAWYAVVQVTITSGTAAATPKVFKLVANTLQTSTEAAALANKIADHVRRRTQANVEASADGDAISLGSEYGAIQMMQESDAEVSPGNLRTYKTDGTTSLGDKVLNTDAAAVPITGIS